MTPQEALMIARECLEQRMPSIYKQEPFNTAMTIVCDTLESYLGKDNYTDEEWRDVSGYSGYKVSSFGRVCSFKRTREGEIKTQVRNNHGYMCVALRDENYIQHNILVHRLVADAFIPNPDHKETVNHINEDKTDNRVCNLEWATLAEQMNHGTRKHSPVSRLVLDEKGRQPRELIAEKAYLRKRGYLLDSENFIAYWTNDTKRAVKIEAKPRFYMFKEYNGESADISPIKRKPWRPVERINDNGEVDQLACKIKITTPAMENMEEVESEEASGAQEDSA